MSEDPLVRLVILYLTTPMTDLYLSKVIGHSSHPKLEPFGPQSIHVGEFKREKADVTVELVNVMVHGLSNVQIPKSNGTPDIQVNGDEVNFTAVLPNTEAPPAGISSTLDISADYIITPVGGKPFKQGALHITIQTSKLTGQMKVTSANGQWGEVVTTFQSLEISTDTSNPNMVVKAEADFFVEEMINATLNMPKVLAQIVDRINNKLTQPEVLEAISASATKAARKTAPTAV